MVPVTYQNFSLVIDTNVLVSAALKADSKPAQILTKILEGQLLAILCPSVILEYREVLKRPIFKKWNFPPLWFEELIAQTLVMPTDPPLWTMAGPDPDDLNFLSLAHSQGACLVTGNIKDYPLRIRKGTPVVAPSEYLDWFRGTEFN